MSTSSSLDILRSNAFTGSEVAEGEWNPLARKWGLKTEPPRRKRFLADDFDLPLDLHRWDSSNVGYGIVAPFPKDSTQNPAKNTDLSETVRQLIAERGNAPVLRFDPAKPRYLTNCASNKDFDIAQSGIGVDAVPQYLLILGGPAEVPWNLQFQLNSRRFVGRLPLEGAALDNYIRHLLNGWKDSDCDVNTPVVWSTDYGYPDITELMHKVVAQPLHSKYAANSKILAKAALLEAAAATRANLCDVLAKKKPALVVSTSHGLIGRPAEISVNVGTLVDQNRQPLDLSVLTSSWQPNGAIWYAHACCSAGTDGAQQFQDLVKGDSNLALTLRTLSQAGPCVAPMPVKLLSAEKPARGFIGHVEPTFDITLRNSDTGELFTKPVIDALYTQLLQGNSAGYAMQFLLAPIASVHSAYITAKNVFNSSETAYLELRNYALRGADLEATVLLGDPTVVLPKLR